MSENRVEVAAGAVVLALAAGFLFWAGQGAGRPSGTYPLHAAFRSVEGVVVGTEVRMAGVKIGSVSEIRLNPQTFFADATLALRDDIKLPDDSAALISTEGLMGGSFVEIVPGGSLETLASGGEILDTQGAVSVLSLMMKFAGGGTQEGTQ